MSAARYLLLLPLLLVGCTSLQRARSAELDADRRLHVGLAALDAGLYQEAFDELAWVYSSCAGYAASHQALAGLAALELDPRNPAGRESIGSELLGRLVQHPGPPAWTRPLAESAYLMALGLGAAPGVDVLGPGARGPTTGGPREPAPPDPHRLRAAPTADSAAALAAAAEPAPAAAAADSAAVVGTPVDRPAGAPARTRARETLAVPVAHAVPQGVHGCGARVDPGQWVPPQLPRLPGPSVMAILAQTEAERATLESRTDSLTQALTTARRQLEATQAELERIRKTLKP